MTDDYRKRRVALFRNNFLPYSETFIYDELRHHERYDATVFARKHTNEERFPGHQVVAVERIPHERRRIASLVYAVTGYSKRIDRTLAHGAFSLIHAHFGHNGLYAMRFAKRHSIPLVVTLHAHDVTILAGNEKYQPQWWHYLLRYRRLFREARLFLTVSQEMRDLVAKMKLIPNKALIEGKRMVFCDDSIVRGTQLKDNTIDLRNAGASEVHLRICSPPTISPCRYGIDTPTHGELIANNKTLAEIEEYTTADSLAYLSLEGLKKAVNADTSFCSACFDEKYPISMEDEGAQKELFQLPGLDDSLGEPE